MNSRSFPQHSLSEAVALTAITEGIGLQGGGWSRETRLSEMSSGHWQDNSQAQQCDDPVGRSRSLGLDVVHLVRGVGDAAQFNDLGPSPVYQRPPRSRQVSLPKAVLRAVLEARLGRRLRGLSPSTASADPTERHSFSFHLHRCAGNHTPTGFPRMLTGAPDGWWCRGPSLPRAVPICSVPALACSRRAPRPALRDAGRCPRTDLREPLPCSSRGRNSV